MWNATIVGLSVSQSFKSPLNQIGIVAHYASHPSKLCLPSQPSHPSHPFTPEAPVVTIILVQYLYRFLYRNRDIIFSPPCLQDFI